jgi:hypothetical protein
METKASSRDAAPIDRWIRRYAARTRRHVAWDSALAALPPAIALSLAAFFLHHAGRVSVLWSGYGAAAAWLLALGVAWFWSRRSQPSVAAAARDLDRSLGAADRFLTLATIDPSSSPLFLVEQLRRECEKISQRLDVARDFPYRIKRSFFVSAGTSVAIVFLLFLAFSTTGNGASRLLAGLSDPSLPPRLKSDLAALADELNAKADKKKIDSLARRALGQIEDLIRSRRQSGRETGGLERLAGRLRDAAGQGDAQDGNGDGDGAGGQGETAARPGSRPTGGREFARATETERPGSKDAATEKDRAVEKTGQNTRGRGENPSEDAAQQAGKGPGISGRQKMDEESREGPPPERFLKAGERGPVALKERQFVTVELPESWATAPEDEAGSASVGRRKSATSRVGNVPLSRGNLPEAEATKQFLPLEYRDMIR